MEIYTNFKQYFKVICKLTETVCKDEFRFNEDFKQISDF